MRKRDLVVSGFAALMYVAYSGAHAQAAPASGAVVIDGKVVETPPLPVGTPSISAKVGVGLPADEFGRIVNSSSPLNPDQVRTINRLVEAVEAAKNERPGPAPLPTMNRVRVSFEAGQAPMVIRVDRNITTSVVMTDSTGAPWFIKRVRAGGKDLLDIPEDGKDLQEETNTFTITPLKANIATNVTIFLKGAPSPVVMSVSSGQREVDYRLEVAVQARGPNAEKAPAQANVPPTTASAPVEMDQMLNGITPPGARLLQTESTNVDVVAWEYNKALYLKSKATLLSPRPLGAVSAADGTRIYKTQCAGNVLWFDNGIDGVSNIKGCSLPAFEPVKTSSAAGVQ